jgi:hypothetical protein
MSSRSRRRLVLSAVATIAVRSSRATRIRQVHRRRARFPQLALSFALKLSRLKRVAESFAQKEVSYETHYSNTV